MHSRRSQLPNLEPIDFELEKTLRTHKYVAIKGKIEMDLQQPAPQERPFKDYFSPLANFSTSSIRHPMLFAGKFQSLPKEKTSSFSKNGSDSMGYS